MNITHMTPQEYINNAICTKSPVSAIPTELNTPIGFDILHSVLGMQTESAELTDTLKKSIFYGKPIDWVNCDEEVGDLLWYIAIYLNARGQTFENIMEQNIAKLQKRFPNKFTSFDAQHRDLEGERNILESFNSHINKPISSIKQESNEIYNKITRNG